jgi:hypothetical protein
MSPAPPSVSASYVAVVIDVAVLERSVFSVTCWATDGRVTIFGRIRPMPDVGVSIRRVVAMNGRCASMTPMSSWLNASGTTPALSVVMRSAIARSSSSRLRHALAREQADDLS